MWFLISFCCCLDLYDGCIIIGVSGLIVSIVLFAASYQAAVRSNIGLTVFGFLFCIVYIVAKASVLLGTILYRSRYLFVAFILSVLFVIIALIALVVWIILGMTVLEALVVFLAIILEAYFCWVIFSLWRASADCPQCMES